MIYDAARAIATWVAQSFVIALGVVGVMFAITGEHGGQAMFFKMWAVSFAGPLIAATWPIWIIPIGWLFSFPAKLGYKLGKRP